jgi:signal transduction histidine kinase
LTSEAAEGNRGDEAESRPRSRRIAIAVLAALLELLVLLPFAFLSSESALGLPAAFATAVGAGAAILAGSREGAAAALAGALFFAVLADFHAGALVALGLWPALVLAIGVGAERASRQRLLLQRELREANERLRALIDAGIALNTGLALERVLQQLVEAGRVLTGARYAALGLLDDSGSGLGRFFSAGLDEDERATIGDLPQGRGILGLLIRDPHPLRLDDLGHHPAAAGFPPGHPPMRTFLGVPIIVRGVAYGNLYLTEKRDGAVFDETDEELVRLLAAQAAVAIENARLYEASARWQRQLESLHEVSNVLVGELDLDRLLGLVARRLRELLAARAVEVSLVAGDGGIVVEAADGEGSAELVGRRLDPHSSKSGRVLERGRAERVDSMSDDPEVDQEVTRRLGLRAALFVPLVVRNRAIGVIVAIDRVGADPLFSDDDLRLAQAFAERAAVAVELSQRFARDRVRTILDAQERERRRIAREIHDETGQALTSVLLALKGVEHANDVEQARSVCMAVRRLTVGALQDIRRLAVDLRPPVLDDFGVVVAIERLVSHLREQTGITVHLDVDLPGGRLPGDLETAFYRVAQEALTNVVKHAKATRVLVSLRLERDGLLLAVQDDGCGFSPEVVAGEQVGLLGMRERASLLDGTLEINTTPGEGTLLRLKVPYAPSGAL